MKICKANETHRLPFSSGVMNLLLIGEGTVQLLKSLDGGNSFYQVTDSSGTPVEFEGEHPSDVMFNAEIENSSQQVHYAIKCLEGEVKYQVAK